VVKDLKVGLEDIQQTGFGSSWRYMKYPRPFQMGNLELRWWTLTC